jgi:phosphohistidine swiveling domain-containing protein
MFELQERLGDFACGVIVDAGDVSDEIGKEIVVLASLHPDNLDRMLKAKGVITEAGGAAAHLAQVAMEKNVTIMLAPGATTRYPKGTAVTLIPSEGQIREHYTRR